MAYSVVPTVANGDSWTAAQHNTYLRDNMSALWPYTAAGDIAYALGSSTLDKLVKPTVIALLKMGSGGVPSWLELGTAGDLPYSNGSNLTKLAKPASNTSMLTMSSAGVPAWVDNTRYMGFQLNADAALQVGDDAVRFRIPAGIGGWNIVSVAASRKSGTGVPAIQIRNVSAAVDVLSTKLTIDSGETDSSTAATPAVINAANDDVQTGEQFAIDVDVAGTATLYMWVEIGFRKP